METTDRPPLRGSPGVPLPRVVALALSCHPGPVVAVTALTAALAVSAGATGARCVLVTSAVLAGQLSVGWCNDAFDARRDARTGRRDKPAASGAVSSGTVWKSAYGALLLCTVLSLACGVLAGTVHLAAVGAAWAYNLRLKATALSWLPYVAGFGALPAVVALSMPGHPRPAWWAVAAGALLGVAAHLADVLPDIAGDLVTGIRGLPHRLGAAGTRLLLPVPLVAASVVLVLGPAGSPDAWTAAVPVVVLLMAVAGIALGRYRRKAAFAGAVAVAAVDLVLLLVRGTAIV